MGRLAPVLEIRDGVGDRAIVLGRPLGRLAQRLRRRRLGKALGLAVEELGAVSGYGRWTSEMVGIRD